MRVEPWHQIPWDWRAAVQFICGGTGSGLLFFTALAAWQEPAWLARTGWQALAFVGLGLLFVWLKLGRRWRALFVFLNPRTSWMSREALLSLPLLSLGLLAVWLRSPIIGLAAAVFGLGFLYAQAQMLKASTGIPVWREPLIVPLIFSTGLAEGAALLLVATAAFGGIGAWLPVALFLIITARLWLWLAYRRKLCLPGAAPVGTAAVLNRLNGAMSWLGHAVPLIGLSFMVIAPTDTAVPGLIAGLAALLGGWYLKFSIVTRAGFNQGFALARTPARTPGYSGPGTQPGWRAEG